MLQVENAKMGELTEMLKRKLAQVSNACAPTCYQVSFEGNIGLFNV